MQENSTPTDKDEAINLLGYIKIVAKRSRLILYGTMTAAVIAIIVSFLLPVKYLATAKIIPPQQSPGLIGLIMGQMGGGAAGLAGSILGTGTTSDQYAGILDSEQIKKTIVNRFKLMEVYDKNNYVDTFKKLDNLVDISIGKKNGIISISVEDENAKRAADIANAYVEELGKLDAKMDISGARQDRLFYENRLEKAKADLVKAEDAMKAFQTKNKELDVPAQAQMSIAGIAELRGQLAMQETQLAALRSHFTDNAQEVKYLKTAIAKIRSQIAELEGNGNGGSIPSVGSVPALGQEYLRLMREFKIQETLVELLTKQDEFAKISEEKNYSTIQIVQSAETPDKKSKPKRGIIVLAATFGTFFLTVLLALVLEYIDRMPEEDREQWREVRRYLPELNGSFFSRFNFKR